MTVKKKDKKIFPQRKIPDPGDSIGESEAAQPGTSPQIKRRGRDEIPPSIFQADVRKIDKNVKHCHCAHQICLV